MSLLHHDLQLHPNAELQFLFQDQILILPVLQDLIALLIQTSW